jgi:hypothetical protein
MSRRVYFIQRQITFSEFANVLAIPSLEVELDDSPTNCYPYVRLTLGDASLMARTNMDGHVFQLDAIHPDSDGHRKIANIIAELFNTEITLEDRNFGPEIPWVANSRFQKRHGNFNSQKRSSRCQIALIQAQGAAREGELDSFPYR